MNLDKRPNILFAIADDASHMSAYGHRFLNTPNFDRIARNGMLFKNAFTTNPKCAPSRASILTGRHTWQLEEACNHYGIFPAKFTVYPDLLEEAGYHIGYTGKGWAPGDWKRGGCKRNPAGPEYNKYTLTPPPQTCISEVDYARNFEDFIDKRPQGVPFYFWYGGHEPHRPYNQDEGLRAGKDPADVYIPAYLPDDTIVRHDLLDYAYEIEWFDMHLGLLLDKIDRLGEIENTLVIATSDNGMPFPRVKGQMYEDDCRLPLAVMWPMRAAGNRTIDDLISFIDFAPTMLETAGLKPHSQVEGKSFLNIITSNKSGRIDPGRDKVYMGRERHDMGSEGDRGYPVRIVRTMGYLYVRNFAPDRWPAGNPETGFTNIDSSLTKQFILAQHAAGNDAYFKLAMAKRPEEELYDIHKDPECMKNLAYHPEYEALKNELWADLKAFLQKTGDPRISGKGDVFDAYEYVGDITHSWKAYTEGWFKPQKF